MCRKSLRVNEKTTSDNWVTLRPIFITCCQCYKTVGNRLSLCNDILI